MSPKSRVSSSRQTEDSNWVKLKMMEEEDRRDEETFRKDQSNQLACSSVNDSFLPLVDTQEQYDSNMDVN